MEKCSRSLLALTFLLICNFSIRAQQRITTTVQPIFLEPALLECVYDFSRPADDDNSQTENGEYILQIGKRYAVYMTYSSYRSDSVFIRQKNYKIEAMEALRIIGKYRRPSLGLNTIVRDNQEGKQIISALFVNKNYGYTEPSKQVQWQLRKESKQILGYICKEARCSYGGRTWTAWYAPDIAVTEGPWKLCGLPGLVLEAEDESGKLRFQAITVRKGKEQVYRRKTDEPQILSRAKYLKLYRDFRENPDKYYGFEMEGESGVAQQNSRKNVYLLELK